MANPISVNCPEGEWKKVATNVTAGNIKRLSTKPNKYLETYRMTGGKAPTEISEGVEMFIGTNEATISAAAAIDVYVWAIGESGKLRIDL